LVPGTGGKVGRKNPGKRETWWRHPKKWMGEKNNPKRNKRVVFIHAKEAFQGKEAKTSRMGASKTRGFHFKLKKKKRLKSGEETPSQCAATPARGEKKKIRGNQ